MLLDIRIYRHIIYYYGFFLSIFYLFLVDKDISIERNIYYFFGISLFLVLLWFRYYCYHLFSFGYKSLNSYNSDTLLHFRFVRNNDFYGDNGKILVRIGNSDISHELDLSLLGISESYLSHVEYELYFGSHNHLHLLAFRKLVESELSVKRKYDIYKEVQKENKIRILCSFIVLCLIIFCLYSLLVMN